MYQSMLSMCFHLKAVYASQYPSSNKPDQCKPNTVFSPKIQDGGRTKNYHGGCCCRSASTSPPIIGSFWLNIIPAGSSSNGRLRDLKVSKINSKYFYQFFKNTHKFVISSRRVVFMLNFTVILRGRSPLSSFLYRRVRARVVGWLLNMCAGKLA